MSLPSILLHGVTLSERPNLAMSPLKITSVYKPYEEIQLNTLKFCLYCDC